MDEALEKLAAFDARKAEVVELRYFGGLTMEEIADVLKIHVNSVARDWTAARAWLFATLSGEDLDELSLAKLRSAALGGDENFPIGQWRRANDEFHITADIRVLRKAIAESHGTGAMWPDFRRRCWSAPIQRRHAASPLCHPKHLAGFLSFFRRIRKPFNEALLAVAANSPAKQEALLKARNATDPVMEGDLALLDALLGQKEKAIREATQAIDQTLGPAGSIEKNLLSSVIAMVYAQTDEPDKAIDLIGHLFTVPCDCKAEPFTISP